MERCRHHEETVLLWDVCVLSSKSNSLFTSLDHSDLFFFIIIMDLAMTLKPFVFKTLENVSCYDLLNNGCKEDAEFLSHRLKIFTLISLQQRHNLNYKLGFEL